MYSFQTFSATFSLHALMSRQQRSCNDWNLLIIILIPSKSQYCWPQHVSDNKIYKRNIQEEYSWVNFQVRKMSVSVHMQGKVTLIKAAEFIFHSLMTWRQRMARNSRRKWKTWLCLPYNAIGLLETKEFRFNNFTLHAKCQKLNIYRVLFHSSVANLVFLLHVYRVGWNHH